MPIALCRVCGAPLIERPLLRYENMPRAAQFLPDAAALATERGVDLDVRQCAGCGLVQLSNDPVSYHREVVRAAAFSEEMRAFRKKQFESFAREHFLRGKKVLEIGCGRGEYLSIMAESGAEAYGLEDSAESVAHCVKNGLRAGRGYLSAASPNLEHAPFDAFCVLNFLEHMPDPGAVLRAAARNLTQSGVGLVEVPNFDMILRRRLFSEFIPDHLFYFTKDTLEFTLRLNGFEIVACEEIWHDYILSAVVRPRRPLDLSDFSRSQAELREALRRHISSFGDKKVAIWGAGHQALAVLALTGLSEKIRYVVDSAPFKQGKFTPATHVPIVAPQTLNSDPVDAVIVIAAAYSDEVARDMRKRFSPKIRIAILRDSGLEIDPKF
jgi:2-polyprenyl-3-methyl-5-hydroxy-6-metoxy-1,4-benzoquinol methylase